MKKFKIVLVAVLMFLTASCVTNTPKSDPNKTSIVATIFPQYDFSRQIAKDRADISMLLPLGADSHSYEPSPKDILKIQNADIFIYNGGESDNWIKKILNTIDTSDMVIINLVDICNTLTEEIPEGMQAEENEEAEPDEHVWTSPENAIVISERIADALCEMDGENSQFYRQNFEEYKKQLKELDKTFEDICKNAKCNTLVFADRFPFRYFVERYGLKYYAAFPGCAEETEPSPATVAFLCDKLKSENIGTVFCLEFSNQKLAKTIAESTNADIKILYSCHTVTKEDFDSGITYIDLMEKNAKALKEALN